MVLALVHTCGGQGRELGGRREVMARDGIYIIVKKILVVGLCNNYYIII